LNGDFLRFRDAAVEMEQYAIAALRRPLEPEERDAANALLRHARGIIHLVDYYQAPSE
jgi:hypothetical protein